MKRYVDYSVFLGVEKYDMLYYFYVDNDLQFTYTRTELREVKRSGYLVRDWFDDHDMETLTIIDYIVISDEYNKRFDDFTELSEKLFNKDIDDLTHKEVQLIQFNLGY